MITAEIQRHEQQNRNNLVWLNICELSDLVLGSGVCALIPSKHTVQEQVAIFCIKDNEGQIATYAVSNWDPIGKANVMSRGIICSLNGEIMVSSPLYKQHYSLVSGQCLENTECLLKVYESCIKDGSLLLKITQA
jgi:nitrite reductase (NADH) small subunit